ncbi:DNA-binding GntR family transcriptional regulator [Marinobacterium sp. MBR-111]|jgi:DNA-binding GntR family transcriptional regulator|uniref:GntR family transcriptional regulator n=1 Tax=Marinobacterium sp. MBR-111 TaxID=3156463 RepID=UPI00339B0D97
MRILNKKDLIYQDVLGRLLSRQYKFGEKVSVKDISNETGVSRQPIMTALNNLQERGFVHITAQVGCEVVDPAVSEVADFYRMFSATEGLIASLAAERHSPEELLRLTEINDQIIALGHSSTQLSERYRQLNADFHRHLQRMARSEILGTRQMSNFELSDFFIVQTCGFHMHLNAATDEHTMIIEAIRNRDTQAAREAAEEHIASVSRDVVTFMQHSS